MRRLSAVVTLLALPLGASAADPAPDVKGTIDRGLAFLVKDNLAWKEKRQCAECHHAPMTIWALNEGKKRGHAIDEKVLADLSAWAVTKDRLAALVAKPAERKQIELNEAPLLLALGLEAGDAKAAAGALKELLTSVLGDQDKDGSWKLSYEFRPIGSSPEALTTLALLALSNPNAPDLGKDGSAARDKGLKWLQEVKPDEELPTAALRLILLRRLGRPAAEWEPLVKNVRGAQNADGGWGQIKGAKSDAYATGQALYALAEASAKPGDEAMTKGQAFLAKTQREDGGWAMASRSIMRDGKPPKNLEPITHAGSAWAVMGLIRSSPEVGKDQILFSFEEESAAKDWAAVKLPEVEKEQPAPAIEIVATPKAKADEVPVGKRLKITFAGGDWPTVATTKIPVQGNWKPFQTLKAELTVDRASVAYFRIYQGKPDDKSPQPRWEKTMTLPPGRNDVTLLLRHGIGSLDPMKGDVTSFVIGMFRPEKGQTLLVGNVRLSPDWPPPKVLGWYSPYNHDGYSAAVAKDYARTGAAPKFKVLGTDLEVENLADLAKRVKDKWAKPEPKTIEQVEADFKAEFDKLKRDHPAAVLVLLREGEKGWNPSDPDKAYEGWKVVYVNCHGPDGPNPGREKTPALSDTVEVFMRHRSVLMRADLASIPKGATILAARLVVTRTLAADLKVPEKPNLWVAEPCNRDWDETSANCYFYAKGKHWKGVSGLYYGADPDFWPVFLAHGPAGGGAVSVWDFGAAVKFWRDGTHANNGFFLHGDSNDYMRMYTPKAKDLKQRPALMVIYEPKP